VDGVVAHPRARIFPNGRIDLLVNLGSPQRVVEGRDLEVFDLACVSGLQEGPLVIESTRRTHLFGLRLRPEGAYACLTGATGAVRGRVVGLRDVIGPSSTELVGQLLTAASFADRARIACHWIEGGLTRRQATPGHVGWVVSRIEAEFGCVRIGDLRRSVSLSTRRLNSDFLACVGTTPKTFARIARFRHALEQLQTGGASLTDVALESGYYDHSHMTIDFREFAGVTPSEFLLARYPDGTSATVS
jgi:AraC-like DNA-binding protein